MSAPQGTDMAHIHRDTKSGVRWNRVVPGFNLLQTASSEVQNVGADAPFIRSLYITGVQYLLEGLPKDLTPGEATNIQAKLPDKLKERASVGYPRAAAGGIRGGSHTTESSTPPSIIHRIVAACTLYLCFFIQLFIQILVPHFKVLKRSRLAKTTAERILTASLFTAAKIQVALVFLGSNIAKTLHSDSVLSLLVNVWLGWCAAVVNGLSEGLTEGLLLLLTGSGISAVTDKGSL
ncbi:hypothetical protein LOZ53_000779 [Ophidiomyces ophidiicola]|uniref:Uncharacterized protein n=1 Tax=Ophidiomyces ophidiicola TaxID=1387563 RepID=A0ACB8V589_9EURO|nr:uncharacterized protein LOZ57_003406 [Ophidiomyces ophidiicola]KAI1915449.1 hypothetical protein LOZ61_001643 [Ophidiomyces ophidiicola]KAI1926063.1 hypothetical protein LOZ64_000380 [Ophidiomyces ophidiicola]KAI1929888.1 hypothetical protein LOZ60_001356 [Ophidiomyces ophidiicola]KAI1947168.1 hypothetical protein LOZ57_003406 [Ophidiomyces ophidiicola]KAI1955684.1 hypothetical protein LOZ62_000235 [Ophidiomyces ophidiicola]